MTDEKRSNHGNGETSAAGWVIAVFSALVVLGAVASLLYQAVSEREGPPRIMIEVDNIEGMGDEYLVQFTVYNHGPSTAATLVVEGTLEADTGTVETSETSIDYLPGNGHREAGIFFTHDPRLFELKLRPVGYDLP